MDYNQLKRKAIHLLSLRAHSEKEIKDKLSTKAEDPSLVDQVIEYLNKYSLLNDYEFSKSYVQSRISRFKGPNILKFELQKKGITKETIKEVLNEAFSDLDTQLELARSFLQKKLSWNKLPRMEYKKKTAAALQRRGFSTEIIYKIIDERPQNE